MNTKVSPSERLKEWRAREGLSQIAAGARVGVSGPTWYDWESGNKTPKSVHQITLESVTGVERDAWLSDDDREKIARALGSAAADERVTQVDDTRAA
jgi:transcriptional regulator with XRE-family HTH domain